MRPTPAKTPARKSSAKARSKETDVQTRSSADSLIATLDHPLAAEIATLRKAILAVDRSITDGVKWNSLSFRTTEWFATVNPRSRDSVQLILHLGAKAGKAADSAAIPDPKGLLTWKGQDRAIATLGSGAKLKANLPALRAILKAWLPYV
jgi:predicted transport protein